MGGKTDEMAGINGRVVRQRRRLRLQYSLRVVLFIGLVIGLLLTFPVRRVIKQKAGRDWVAAQNGHVVFGYQFNSETGAYDHRAEPPAPRWLIEVVGIDWFTTVEAVTLDNRTVEDLKPLQNLKSLKSLAIMIDIDDELDFRPLTRLSHLQNLQLDYSNISDEQREKLKQLLPQVRIQIWK